MFRTDAIRIHSHVADSFDRETERDWDKELAEDVKGECEGKYGSVEFIKVEKESAVRFSG